MFDRHDPTAKPSTDPATSELTFEIDPLRAPFFKILQPVIGEDRWAEVGFVWAAGLSRTNGIENWWLYDRTAEGDRERAAYRWPGFDANGRNIGQDLRLEPATPPPATSVSQMRDYLQRTYNVTLTHVKAAIAEGR